MIRLVWALLTTRFRPRIEPLDEGVLQMRVWPNDLDFNMHVNSGRYLSLMDIGRVELFGRMRFMREVLRRGWRPINGGTMITYRRSLFLFERFVVRSRIVCWDEKWFYFEQVLERLNGELVSTANVRGLVRASDGNIAPSTFFSLMGRGDLVSPPMPSHIARWNEAEAAR